MGTNPSFISVSESVNRGQTPIYAVVGARLSSSQYIWSNSGPSCINAIKLAHKPFKSMFYSIIFSSQSV